MTRTGGWLAVLACALLAAWLAWMPGRRPPRPTVSSAGTGSALRAADADEIRQRVSRLREHLASPAPLAPSHRNPFQFRAPAITGASRRADAGAPPPDVAAAPGRPEMTLLGMAEDGVNGTKVRTAVVSVLGQLYFLREGDRLLERFLVLRVASNEVEIKDREGGTFRLTLR